MSAMPPASPEDVVAAAEQLTLNHARLRLGWDRFATVVQAIRDDEPDESRVLVSELLHSLTNDELVYVVCGGAQITARLLRRLEDG